MLHTPHTRQPLHLFQDRASGEALLLHRELSAALGYRSLSGVLRRNPHFVEDVHSWLLSGRALRRFKSEAVEEYQITELRRSSRVLLLRESCFPLLLGRECKNQALLAGEWLVSQIFPRLHHDPHGVYYAWLECRVFGEALLVFRCKGRLGFVSEQIARLFSLPALSYDQQRRYLRNLHLGALPQQAGQLLRSRGWELSGNAVLLFESGLYRYLHLHGAARNHWWLLERLVLPVVRRSEVFWQSVAEEAMASEASLYLCEETASLLSHSQRREEISGWNAQILARLDALIQYWESQMPALRQEIRGLADKLERGEKGKKSSPGASLSLVHLKKVAQELGVYHLDRQTPHIVFVKALVDYVGSDSSSDLAVILENLFALREGENKIELPYNTYRIWKK